MICSKPKLIYTQKNLVLADKAGYKTLFVSDRLYKELIAAVGRYPLKN